jgi:hypothetical protein
MTIFSRSRITWISGLALGAALLGTPALALAASPKTYQVTGPVLEVNDATITVEKDKEKWQIARDKDTKVTGDLKPGAKVTIQYRMTATSVDVKGDKAGKDDSGGKAAATKAKAGAKK